MTLAPVEEALVFCTMGAARPAHYEESNVSYPGTFYYVLARRFAGVRVRELPQTAQQSRDLTLGPSGHELFSPSTTENQFKGIPLGSGQTNMRRRHYQDSPESVENPFRGDGQFTVHWFPPLVPR
jgi:hypothetical protein